MARWEGVIEFVAVADVGSFTKAASKLSTSVAQVSRRVSDLERHLGLKLLHRTTRQVSLTEAGQHYYNQCKSLIEGLELAERSVTHLQATPKGLVRITAPVTFGEHRIAPILNQFLAQHPDVELDLVLTNQPLDLIEAGIDIAIRLGKLADSTHIAKKLGERQRYMCATPAYLNKAGEPHTLSELSHHQCLVGSAKQWRFQRQNKEVSLSVQGRLCCNSGYALVDAAKRDLGLIQLPDYYVESELAKGNLVEVLKQYRPPKEGIWALYPHNRQLSAKVKLVIEFLTGML